MKKTVFITSMLIWAFATIVFAGSQDNRLNDLLDQLSGKICKYEVRNGVCVQRKPFAYFFRRSDKEQCVIDAAQVLGKMGDKAQSAVTALIEALNKYHNVDSGDGIIPVRSEIALALGQIGDPAAIKPLIAILASEDSVTLSASASVPEGYKLIQGTSYGAVAQALGMFGSRAKEALPALNALMTKEQGGSRTYDLSEIKEAIAKISQ